MGLSVELPLVIVNGTKDPPSQASRFTEISAGFGSGPQKERRSLGEQIANLRGELPPQVCQSRRFSWFILRPSYLPYRPQASSPPRGRARTDPRRDRIQPRLQWNK
jgi:hypothetical protein